ncbi:MAG: type I asparaginase [Bacteroidales bacterium]|nr:type I asparaginase [Bacteroidales bacterium]
MANDKISILIIYTGGTIGMIKDPASGVLKPFRFDRILQEVPELGRFGFNISSYAFNPPIDSSNVNPGTWIRIAEIIEQNYEKFDGFVVLHGTDTMAYSASALSFMLENLGKPVIFTGSQLPIDVLRTDGKENLIASLEIASSKTEGKATVPEVCIFFENRLLRGNRTSKNNVDDFNAFFSANYPPLAESGVHIKYNYQSIANIPEGNLPLTVHKRLDTNIAILKIFPGITQPLVHSVINTPGLKALVMETFGAGNAPNTEWLIDELKTASDRGIVILNITQCRAGCVEMSMYETGLQLARAGVAGGKDITTEAAVTKLMFLMGKNLLPNELIMNLNSSLRGEITL